MTGAIEFLKAWRDICSEHKICPGCPMQECCEFGPASPTSANMSDEEIADLIRKVMAEARKKEARKK